MEVYVSVDIEADGPIPGQNSMLSIGAVAFSADGEELTTLKLNLLPIPGAKEDPDTMAWWKTQPEAWKRATVEAIPASDAMHAFSGWLDLCAMHGKVVFVGYPASYDFLFVYWYMIKFIGRSQFGFQALDIKTLAYAAMGCGSFRGAVKKRMPAEWLEGTAAHTHDALDDARGQGQLFFKVREVLAARWRGQS